VKLRVLIADDHAVVREGLAAILNRQPDLEVVAEASDGLEALSEWRRLRPDLCLLDLRMPGLDAIGVIEHMRREDPNARAVVLTTYDNDEGIYQSVRVGARGYLLKDCHREALLDCLRRVAAGEICLPAEVAAKLAQRVHADHLTAREVDVLSLLVRGHNNKDIAQQLLIGENTVKTHLKGIFSKLGVLSRAEAIAVATRRGLVS
jgi:DNA-binding NarL/FixJ family response regulator